MPWRLVEMNYSLGRRDGRRALLACLPPHLQQRVGWWLLIRAAKQLNTGLEDFRKATESATVGFQKFGNAMKGTPWLN